MTTNNPYTPVEQLKPSVAAMRIIVAALLIGVLTFAGVAVFLNQSGAMGPADPGLEFLIWLGAAGATVAVVASAVLPAIIAKSARRAIAVGAYPVPPANSPGSPFASLSETTDAGKLAAVYQTKMIVAAALLEGAAFFNLVAFLLTRSFVALGAAIALALLIAAQFPSASRVAQWIDEQLRLMGDEKTLTR